MTKYRISKDGTFFKPETPDELVRVLDHCRKYKVRVVLDYGDTTTKKSWGETNDIVGYISRSTGAVKIPILVFNSRSIGGGAILDHCILSVRTSKGKTVLYQL